MKTNPTTFRIDYISPEMEMLALNTGDILIGLSIQSSESEDLNDEYDYNY